MHITRMAAVMALGGLAACEVGATPATRAIPRDEQGRAVLAAATAPASSEPRNPSEQSEPSRAAPAAGQARAAPLNGNVLVILLDDLASHQIEAYGHRPSQPATPNITALAETGVLFQNAYAFASCTPGRAALMTGRYPTRSGMGNAMEGEIEDSLMPLSELTLPEMLKSSRHGYTSALIGKWHLTSLSYPGARFAPNDQGFDWYEGALDQLNTALFPTGGRPTDYYRWERITNGRPDMVTDYATTVTADTVVERTQVMPEPWFMVAAFNAPHTPLHAPPANLHNQDLTGVTCGDITDPDAGLCYNAMVEAADAEIGRMLATIDPDLLSRTTVILTADNGTPEHGIFWPYDPNRDKGTLLDGGNRVPFIVTGPFVTQPGTVTEGFVNIVDIFATVAEIADVRLGRLTAWDGSPLVTDSVSFLPLLEDPAAPANPPRDQYVYSELFFQNGAPPYDIVTQMVRTPEYKLIRERGTDQMYRYRPGALDEGPNMLATAPPNLADAPANLEMTNILEDLNATVVYEGP